MSRIASALLPSPPSPPPTIILNCLTEWSLVDLGESETSSLVGIAHMGVIIVEVVKRRITASRSCSHGGGRESVEAEE